MTGTGGPRGEREVFFWTPALGLFFLISAQFTASTLQREAAMIHKTKRSHHQGWLVFATHNASAKWWLRRWNLSTRSMWGMVRAANPMKTV